MTSPQDPPVSVKAALRWGERWVLLRNDRGEWELPGGRVDPGDATLADVVLRECKEELGLEVEVGELVSSYLFEVVPGRRVTIVCFAATVPAQATEAELVISAEHTEAGLFTLDDLAELPIPTGYREAIERSSTRRGGVRPNG